jgi:hypothetical protein
MNPDLSMQRESSEPRVDSQLFGNSTPVKSGARSSRRSFNKISSRLVGRGAVAPYEAIRVHPGNPHTLRPWRPDGLGLVVL